MERTKMESVRWQENDADCVTGIVPIGAAIAKYMEHLTMLEMAKMRTQTVETPWVQDLRVDADGTIPAVARVDSWAKLNGIWGVDVDRSRGWDAAPEGAWVYKLIGFQVRSGVAAYIPMILGKDGKPAPMTDMPDGSQCGIFVWCDWPGLSPWAPEFRPRPAYSASGVGGFTDINGVVGFGYSNGSQFQGGLGCIDIWPNADPEGGDVQYCDCAKHLGWADNHVTIANPIFQKMQKPITTGPGPDPEPEPEPTPTDNIGCLGRLLWLLTGKTLS